MTLSNLDKVLDGKDHVDFHSVMEIEARFFSFSVEAVRKAFKDQLPEADKSSSPAKTQSTNKQG